MLCDIFGINHLIFISIVFFLFEKKIFTYKML